MQDLRQTVERVLGDLAAMLGEHPGLDPNGVITLELADDVVCSLEVPRAGDHVYLHAPVLRLPSGTDATSLVERALVRNAFGLRMPTAWLALDSETRSILLCAAVPADTLPNGGLAALLLDIQREVTDARAVLGARTPPVSQGTATIDPSFMVKV